MLQSLDLRKQIVVLCHDTQIVGHPRCWKTLELVSWNYWWPQMSKYISQYVSTYDLCLQMKPWQHSSVGELQLLSVPDEQWDTLMGIKRFSHRTKVKARSERQNLQTALQLCTKQVGTGEINQIIESLLKVKVQRITKTY